MLPALGPGLCAAEAAGTSLLCATVSSSHGQLHPGAVLQARPWHLLQQLIYSVQTPVALFWFLVIIAQKSGLAVPKYGILGLEGQGRLLTTGGEIPPQLAASLNSSGEADGNRAKWLRLFSFLRNSKARFEGQSWLLDGCSEPVFKSTPPCRSAVGHQGQAQAVVPLWSNCCSLVGQQPRRFQTRACTCGASWGFWWGP